MWQVSIIVHLIVTLFWLNYDLQKKVEVEGFYFLWSILRKCGHFYWISANAQATGSPCNVLMGADGLLTRAEGLALMGMYRWVC